jgi:hypothetical protein
MGIIVWIIAEVLSKAVNLIGLIYTIVYSFVTLRWYGGLKRLNRYFWQLALSKDQHINVVVQDLFNALFLKKASIKFGSEDDTLSYYFAVNWIITTKDTGLNFFGKVVAFVLNLFERKKGGHLNVALELKMKSEHKVLKKYGISSDCATELDSLEKYKRNIVEYFFAEHGY